MGGDMAQSEGCWLCRACFPFLILSGIRRSGIACLIEQDESEEMTQSEAVAVRSAAMIHHGQKLYEDGEDGKGLARRADEKPDSRTVHRITEENKCCCVIRYANELWGNHDDEAYKRMRYALVKAGWTRCA